MLFNSNGNHQVSYFSVNEIESGTFLSDIEDVKLDLSKKTEQIGHLIKELHLKTIR